MWLRRRIRACIWKQWKNPRTRIRELRKMGTRLKFAIFAGITRKGPWHSARTKAIQIGISNSWLTKKGLICVKDLWVKIHYSAAQACPLRGSGYGPIKLMNRRMRTRMSGGVGRRGESPLFTRLCDFLVFYFLFRLFILL